MARIVEADMVTVNAIDPDYVELKKNRTWKDPGPIFLQV